MKKSIEIGIRVLSWILILFVFSGLIYLYNTSEASVPKPKWQKFFKEIDGKEFYLFKHSSGMILVKPEKDLKIDQVFKTMGKPLKEETVVVRGEGEDRPKIYKMFCYEKMIFVTCDISAFPGTVEFIIIKG